MYRLGLRLALRSGKEAFTRLVLTMIAVAVGVTILLAIFADFHAFQATNGRPSWESTTGVPVSQHAGSFAANEMLWNYSENIFKGRFIEQLGVAALGSNAPLPPGISKLPATGQYYVSPGLASLIQKAPYDELGARFPGKQVGTISNKALTGPQELVAYVGYSPSQLASLPNTIVVSKIASASQSQGTTNLYRAAFGVGAIAILFPILVLISVATRLAAARREERYAAMRLIGFTPHQINIIASVDAVVGALLGAILGIGVFLLIQPSLAKASLSGVQFFASYVTPTIWGYVGMLILVPATSAVGSMLSLRRVQISPLGVSHKVTPRPLCAWRIVPLLVGIPVVLYPVLHKAKTVGGGASNTDTVPALFGFLLVMVGLMVGGSWLTMQAARLMAKLSRRLPSLLAARRLADNPKVAFRSVSGLVLAAFIGAIIAIVAPTTNAAQSPAGDASLTNVLRVSYTTSPTSTGLSPGLTAKLTSKLQSYPGVGVIPIYMNPDFASWYETRFSVKEGAPIPNPPNDSIASCEAIEKLDVLGVCSPGVKAVTLNVQNLTSDNPLDIYQTLPLVNHSSPTAAGNPANLSMSMLLVKANNLSNLEKARTFLTTFNATVISAGGTGLTGWQMGKLEPITFGEVAQVRNQDDTNIEHIVLGAMALTLFVAGCSLAVTLGGGLVERKRPFTLLRLSGIPTASLYGVVLLESLVPLLTASIVATGVGFGVAIPLLKGLVPTGTKVHYPGSAYYLAMGVGLGVSVLAILLTMPLLGRITKPDDARFE